MQKLHQISLLSYGAIVQFLNFRIVVGDISRHAFFRFKSLTRREVGVLVFIVFDRKNSVNVLIDNQIIHLKVLIPSAEMKHFCMGSEHVMNFSQEDQSSNDYKLQLGEGTGAKLDFSFVRLLDNTNFLLDLE